MNPLTRHNKRITRYPLSTKPGAMVELDGIRGKVLEVVQPGAYPATFISNRGEPYDEISYVVTGLNKPRWQPCSRCKLLSQNLTWDKVPHEFRPKDIVKWKQRFGDGKSTPISYGFIEGEVVELLDPNQTFSKTHHWKAHKDKCLDVTPVFARYPSQVPARKHRSYFIISGDKLYWISEPKLTLVKRG
jgi:hypothetical protein